MPPDQPRRGWRSDVKPAERKSEVQKAWRREPAAAAPVKRAWSKRTKLGLVGCAILAVVGGIIALILMIQPPKPVYLALVGAGYEDNLAIPHNVYGLNAQADLRALAEADKDYFHITPPLDAGAWKQAFAQFKDQRKKEETFVLYLALHGGADDQGPYLLLDDPNPGATEKSLVRLSDILGELRALPPETKKLLVLDATQPRAVRRLMVENDFARALADLNEKIREVPNLVVLSSTGPYQRSWYDEERRLTAFGYYLGQGLKGEAEPSHNRIDALGLFRYVQKKVRRWAHDNRDAVQSPVLLPAGDEGTRRAKAMALAVAREGHHEPELPQAPRIPYDKLKAAWEQAAKVLREPPPAAVYGPHLVADYLDSLLRAEQLYRAGAASTANDLLDSRLPKVLQKILAAKELRGLDSASAALPLPAALGLSGALPRVEDARLESLWNPPPGRTRRDIWADLTGRRKEAEKLLLVRLGDWMLDQKLNDPERLQDNLGRAAQVLRDLEIGLEDRPAELHHLAMWDYDLRKFGKGAFPGAELVLAVQTRRLAERAALGLGEGAGASHPYSELVFPWVRNRMRAADRDRRDGQDLLFSSDPADRARARTLLTRAKTEYDRALQTAQMVRSGFETRAEVMARLPYYSGRLARIEDNRRRDRADDALASLERLWQEVHDLDRLLEHGPPANPDGDRAGPPAGAEDAAAAEKRGAEAVRADEESASRVSREARAVREQFDRVEKRFREDAGQLRGEVVNREWHRYEAALAVPFLHAARRVALLKALREMSRQLNHETGARPGGLEEDPGQEDRARARAQRRGRILLAMLGRDTFDRNPTGRKFDAVKEYVRTLTLPTSPKWWEPLALVSREVGLRWREMAADVAKDVRAAHTGDLDAAVRDHLNPAERLCRQIDGAGARDVEAQAGRSSPVEENRRVHLHHLLAWMARRTLDDRYFGEKNRPYYQLAGMGYVRDAEALLADRPEKDRREPTRELREELGKRPALSFAWSAQGGPPQRGRPEVHVTSEPEFRLAYQMVPEGLAGGYAVFYAEPDPSLKSVQAGALEALTRTHARPLTPGGNGPIRLPPLANPSYENLKLFGRAVPSTKTEGELKTCAVHGLYRGYEFDCDTQIYFHDKANTIAYQYPLPPRAAVLVYADEEMHRQFNPREGSLAILVDYSDSMNNKTTNQSTRIKDAKRALRAMLKRLPKGLDVSLWLFHGPSSYEGEDDSFVRRVEHSPGWNPDEDFDRFVAALDRRRPSGGTPLVRAMREARDELLNSRRRQGRKTMVILTDGVPDDNSLWRGAALKNRFQRIERNVGGVVRDLFDRSGILVHVVGFRVSELEPGERPIKEVFQKAIESKEVGGKFHPVEKVDDLIRILNETLDWQYELGRPKLLAGSRPAGEKFIGYVSKESPLEKWVPLPVPPRGWDFHETKLFPDYKDAVSVNPGELKIYKLTERDLRRPSYLKRLSGARPWPEKARWRLAVPDNFRDLRSRQDLLVLVENTAQDLAPAQVWLELHRPDGTPALGVRWGNRLGYPTAAWGVEAAHYLNKGAVQAWVRDTRLGGQTEYLPKGEPLGHFDNRTVKVEGVEAVVESVRVEPFPRVDPLGRRRRGTQWCVVVRMNYPKGKPFFAQPFRPVDPEPHEEDGRSAEGGGYEHHFYADAGGRGKYTGLFWYGGPGDEKDVKDRIQGLTVYSVEAFKNETNTTQGLVYELLSPPREFGKRAERFLQLLGFGEHTGR